MSSGSVSSGAERQWQRRLELEEQHSAQLEGKSAGMAMDQLGMGLLFRIGFPSVQYNRRKKAAPTHVHVEPCLLQRKRLNCFPKLCNVEYIVYCFLLLATGQVRDPFLF